MLPEPSSAGAGGGAGSRGGSGGAGALGAGAGGSGVLGGTGGEGDACDQLVYSQGAVPSTVGCFAGTDQGWMPIPCLCDLWLKNTTHDPLAVTLTLSLTEAPPSSADAPGAEVDIQDPDSIFYAVWSQQAAAGAPIAVVRSSDITAVQLHAANVVLDPVSVPACRFVTGTARMNGSAGELGMHADFLDATGSVVLTSDSSCLVLRHL